MASSINASTTAGVVTTADTSGVLNIQTVGTTAIAISASQNVGVGVTPSAWGAPTFQVSRTSVYGSGSFTAFGSNWFSDTGDKYIASDYATQYYQLNGQHVWRTAPSGTAGNTITFTQAMTLDASGQLGIGTTSPVGKLEVKGGAQLSSLAEWNSKATSVFSLANPAVRFGIGYDANDIVLLQGFDTTNGARNIAINAYGGNLLVGTASKFAGGIDGLDLNTTGETGITFGKSGVVKNYFYLITNESAFQWQTVSGVAVNIISSTNGVTLANGGTSWGSLSDERKKDIIEPITDATTKVSGLRAVIGKYKTEEDGIRRAMLIAQDVQAVLPEAVTENADGDLILQYTDTIPLLVAAIKEQTALITQLQADVAALKGA